MYKKVNDKFQRKNTHVSNCNHVACLLFYIHTNNYIFILNMSHDAKAAKVVT